MNSSGLPLVAARGSAFPVSDRKLGSANGNRTCIAPVQLSSVRSKCFILRSLGTMGAAPTVPHMADVAARWQRTALKTRPTTTPGAARTNGTTMREIHSKRKVRYAFAS